MPVTEWFQVSHTLRSAKYICTCEDHLKAEQLNNQPQMVKLAPTANATYVISKKSRDGACISRPTQRDIPLSLAGPILLTSLGFTFSEDLGITRTINYALALKDI